MKKKITTTDESVLEDLVDTGQNEEEIIDRFKDFKV